MSNTTSRDADPAPELENIIEIQNPSVDVAKVMADIRATLSAHGPLKQPSVPAFGMAPIAGEGELAFQLSQANLNYDQVWAEVNVIKSPIPVVGSVVGRAKAMLHELAVYYVNMHAAKQINVNSAIVRVLNALVQSQSAELAALHSELEQLRARVAELESRR